MTESKPTHTINTIHDDILKSINFELQKQATLHDSVISHDISEINGQKVKQVDKIKFLGVIIDDQLSWNDQIKYVNNKLMSTIVLIKRIKKFIPSSHYFKIYHPLFISHLTCGILCWGGICPSKLIKMFNIKKRCVRILFGDNYSFDHPECYLICARARTYMDHTTLKNYSLEHTKPIFNKHKLLTLNNLYVQRSLAELIKILK